MTKELAPIAPISFNDIERMAAAVAKSKLFGLQTTDQAIGLMLIAQAEGLHPAIAARDYHIIQGRPALKADAMMARFQQAGGKVEWKTLTNEKVTAVFSHPQGGNAEISWSIDDAKRIGLTGKDNWKNYPRAMLRSRVVSEGIRTVYPGCVVGVYTPEEVQDFDGPTINATATPVAPTALSEPALESVGEIYNLYVPGKEDAYASYRTPEMFVDGVGALIKKIRHSPKLNEDEAEEKVQALLALNEPVISELPAEVQTLIELQR